MSTPTLILGNNKWAIKEESILGYAVEDRNGLYLPREISFSRASNGTRINSAGLVEVCPWNLASYSEEFSNATWTKSATTLSANTTVAPNGTTTADTLIENTANSTHQIFQSITNVNGATPYTAMIYVKENASRNVAIRIQDGAFTHGQVIVTYNLNTGALISQLATGNGVIVSTSATLTNGYYLIAVSFSINLSTSFRYDVLMVNGTSNSYTGDGTSSIVIWGAQLNIGSTAKPYFQTTDRLNVPRLTYQNGGGGYPSLLLEKQSTNLILRSEEFDNAAWTKIASSVTANSTISPDGTQNADTLTGDGTSSTHSVFQSASLISGANYTISVYAKKNTNNFLQIYGFSTGYGVNSWANFDLNNGVVGSVGSSTTASIVNVGNGWYRCTISIVAISTATDAFVLNLITSATSSRGENSTLSTSVFLWGCQFESGSYPTSYIPTTSASATRVADACFKTGISSLIGQTEGVIFIDFQLNQAPSDVNGRLLQLWATNDTTNAIIPIINQSRQLQITTFGSSVGSAIINASPSTLLGLGQNKIAVAYTSTSVVVYRNGVLFASGNPTGFFPTSLTSLDLGGSSFATRNLGNPINQAVLFPTLLTNAELASLTTL